MVAEANAKRYFRLPVKPPINLFQLDYTNSNLGDASRGWPLTADSSGYLYRFGGEGYSASGGPCGHQSDVWLLAVPVMV